MAEEVRAPVSMCLIVKNEPLLEQSLLSIRNYVKEIVIVDTGSTDGKTQEIAKKYADIFEIYTDCNDPETGLIEDFSKARQRSFELATQPWVAWMDADDIIVNGELFNKLINNYSEEAKTHGIGIIFPYEYSYDQNGQCTCVHYRERIVSDKNKFHWVNPVHEVLINNDNACIFYTHDDIIYKHQRQFGTKVPETGRNLRILKKYVEKVGDSDPRQLYYIGLEYFNSGFIDESIQNLSKYIDLSGWDDERAMAALKLVDIFLIKEDLENALKWAFKTIELKENWAEGYFALGKIFYFLAQKNGEIKNWQKCVYFIKFGLSLPPTKTLLFINPVERAYEIHKFYNFALSKIGDLNTALDSVNIALKNNPNDEGLLLNKKIYELYIAKNEINKSVNILYKHQELDKPSCDVISALIDKQIIATEKDKLINSDLITEPQSISSEQLEQISISLWKQYILYDEIDKAIIFLNNVPNIIKNAPSIVKAIDITNKAKNSIYYTSENFTDIITNIVTTSAISSKKLDIIFFAGDGVEIWTPQTIKTNGIGGSETMLMEQAKRLASFGHKVRVYNSCGNYAGFYDGVEYLQTAKYNGLKCDVLVVSRRADMLLDQYNIEAKIKLLWVHDIYAVCSTNEALLKANKILALTKWHKQNIINTHNVSDDHVLVTRNGIDLSRFNKHIKRNKFKVVNSSSPDRSWPILLDCWPKIKASVPQAELHLFYGFKNWEFSARFDPAQSDLIARLKNQIKQMEPLGVVFHDRVSQDELANQFLSAGVWAHPTWFTETSCITAMEAQAAGLRIVTSSIAALNETVSNRGTLIDGDWTSDTYKEKFIVSVIAAMQNDNNEDRIKLQEYAKNNFDLDSLAKDWEKMFYNLIEESKTNPMPTYQPINEYRKC